jgi:hypothetical protein
MPKCRPFKKNSFAINRPSKNWPFSLTLKKDERRQPLRMCRDLKREKRTFWTVLKMREKPFIRDSAIVPMHC